eukprot:3517074-Prymnesium_polylepis.1
MNLIIFSSPSPWSASACVRACASCMSLNSSLALTHCWRRPDQSIPDAMPSPSAGTSGSLCGSPAVAPDSRSEAHSTGSAATTSSLADAGGSSPAAPSPPPPSPPPSPPPPSPSPTPPSPPPASVKSASAPRSGCCEGATSGCSAALAGPGAEAATGALVRVPVLLPPSSATSASSSSSSSGVGSATCPSSASSASPGGDGGSDGEWPRVAGARRPAIVTEQCAKQRALGKLRRLRRARGLLKRFRGAHHVLVQHRGIASKRCKVVQESHIFAQHSRSLVDGRLDAKEGMHECMVRWQLQRQPPHKEGRLQPVPVLLLRLGDGLSGHEQRGEL